MQWSLGSLCLPSMVSSVVVVDHLGQIESLSRAG